MNQREGEKPPKSEVPSPQGLVPAEEKRSTSSEGESPQGPVSPDSRQNQEYLSIEIERKMIEWAAPFPPPSIFNAYPPEIQKGISEMAKREQKHQNKLVENQQTHRNKMESRTASASRSVPLAIVAAGVVTTVITGENHFFFASLVFPFIPILSAISKRIADWISQKRLPRQ